MPLVTFAASGNITQVQILELESRRSLGSGVLAGFLASPDETVAVRAALAIGRTKNPSGYALLAGHVNDARVAVRAMSVYGIGLIASPSGGDAVVRALGDTSGAVRVAALDAAARYQAARAFSSKRALDAQQAVEVLLLHDRDEIVRARAATALVEFRDGESNAEAADTLALAYRTDRSPLVRWHAMWSIYRGFAHRAGLSVIEDGLKSGEELVRIEAVRAMGRFQDASLVAVVRPLLQDPSWRVQEQAGETIRLLQGKTMHDHWTSIPASIHLPPREPDALAGVAAIPWNVPRGKPSAPAASMAAFAPVLDPKTSRAMTEPAPGLHPRVRIVTTKGNLYVTLYPEWAPLTVANFTNVAAHGYYDNNRWFRIVPDFVVQTGDPNDNGEGDAGYTIGAEENPLEQRSYIISMGMNYDPKLNLPLRDSAGTQYYITLSPQLHLDRDFTVYGEVTSGFDVLARLVESDRVKRIERLPDVMVH